MSVKIKSTEFRFHGDLPLLLRGRWKDCPSITYSIGRRASIKDVIESFGLPHTEVGAIELNGQEVDFSFIVEDDGVFDIQPVPVPYPLAEPTVLRPVPLRDASFIVDVNVGRLARYMRAAGLDTFYDPAWNDAYISDSVHQEQRILLTRDMRLLMRKQVVFGRYVRATNPVEQLREVIDFFGLEGQLAPFSRCLECNAILEPVEKEKVLHRLEPLTRKYYFTFSRCTGCDKIYWPGSHVERMQALFCEGRFLPEKI